jgi:hypothetical protein
VPFENLGLATPVVLAGVSAGTSFFLPVPDGLRAATLTGRLVAAAGTAGGEVVFSSQGHRLSAVGFTADPAGGEPFSVALGAVRAVNGVVRIDITSSLPLSDRYCQGQFQRPEVDLDGMAVAYSGQSTRPTTVGQFLPPFLDKVRLWVPAALDGPVDEAAIEIADEVVVRYGAQPVTVEVHTLGSGDLPDPGAFDGRIRDVVLTGAAGAAAGPAGVRIAVSTSGASLLVISGDGDALRRQVDLTVGQLVRLVATNDVTAAGQFIPKRIPALEQPFGELGLASLAAYGSGQLQFVVHFAQSDFGQMIDRARLHVSGTYTPVPSGAAASLSVYFNDTLVATRLADRSGAFHVAPVIAPADLRRDNTVEVRFQYVPADGPCARADVPVDVQLSADASVETHAGVSLQVGFQRLPQALLPDSDCAFDVGDPVSLAAAVEVFAGLQRLSRVPLVPRVVPIGQVVSGTRPAVIVTSDPAAITALHPTVDLTAGAPHLTVATSGGHVDLGVAPAVTQVFTNRGRAILAVVTRPEAASSLPALVAAVTAPDELPVLAHDVAVVEPGGHVDDVAVHDTLNPPAVSAITAATGVPWWEWGALAAVPVLLLAALWRVRPRWHRRVRTPGTPETPSTPEAPAP